MTTETARHSLPAPLTADDYAAAAVRRRRRFLLGGILLAVLCAGAFVVHGVDNLLVPLSFLLLVITPVLLWRYPRLALYVTYAAVCLIELEPTGYSDAITDRIPFFWDVNTIFQRYGHVHFKAIPLNLFEVFILTAGVCSVFRTVFSGSASIKVGALFKPIACYMGFVALFWGVGIATGGNFKISLQEVRSQFYFLLAYLMAVNIVQEKRQIKTLFWITAICIGIKGILYTYRRYVTLHGLPLPDQGVGSHEEAFFFDSFCVLLTILALSGVHKKLQRFMWLLLPLVVVGNLATHRRAGTAALIVIVPLLILAAYRALPQRRRVVTVFALLLTITFSIYYPLFRHSHGSMGQAARAINSEFHPDSRDASSDNYRIAEDADLMATIKSAPLGYGYGKRMLHAVPIANISTIYEWWDIMTHNQILWVWMRVGTFGFLAFWMMIASIIIRAGQVIRQEGIDAETKAVGMFTMTVISMLMIFGLLDLQLSNFRDMLYAGFWSGVLAAPALSAAPADVKEVP